MEDATPKPQHNFQLNSTPPKSMRSRKGTAQNKMTKHLRRARA